MHIVSLNSVPYTNVTKLHTLLQLTFIAYKKKSNLMVVPKTCIYIKARLLRDSEKPPVFRRMEEVYFIPVSPCLVIFIENSNWIDQSNE
jgi:hypothetical protein